MKNGEMKGKIHQDIFIGFIIVVFCIAAIIKTFSFHEDSTTYPQLLLGALLILGVGVLIMGIYKSKKMKKGEEIEYAGDEEKLNLNLLKFPGIALAFFVIYGLLITKIGFFSATTIFTITFLWFMGIKKWTSYVLTILFLNAFIYVLFVIGLNVILPSGIFI